MKNLKLLAILCCFSTIIVNAQDNDDANSSINTKYGIKAGYSSLIFKVSVDNESASTDVSGLYFGGFAEISISDDFYFQPELNYTIYFDDGENTSILNIPILAKYYVDERLAIFAGPQLDYSLEEEDSEGFKRLGIGIAAGIAVEISDQLFADVRYSFGINDRIDSELPGFEAFDVETRFNYLLIGLAYRL